MSITELTSFDISFTAAKQLQMNTRLMHNKQRNVLKRKKKGGEEIFIKLYCLEYYTYCKFLAQKMVQEKIMFHLHYLSNIINQLKGFLYY